MGRLRNLGHTGRLLLVLAVSAGVFGIATAVQADIPDSGVIHGCYGKSGTTYKGQLRVRDASQGEQCRYYENPLDWSASGVTGPTGATGPTGPAGVPGLAITGIPVQIPGPASVGASIGCGNSGKIAIAGYLFDTTNAVNTTQRGSGNLGVINGGAASNTWQLTFSVGATTGSGDTIDFQVVCANPPVSNAAPLNGSPSTSNPTVKIVTHPLR